MVLDQAKVNGINLFAFLADDMMVMALLTCAAVFIAKGSVLKVDCGEEAELRKSGKTSVDGDQIDAFVLNLQMEILSGEGAAKTDN